MHPKIIAFTGTHGVGKTTAAYQAAADVKCAQPDKTIGVLVDVENLCPYPINRDCCEKGQLWIFSRKLEAELGLMRNYDLIVADRTIMDVVAYTYALGFKALAEDMLAFSRRHMDYYQSIRFLRTCTFNYHFADGVRDTDAAFRADVEGILMTFYQMAGITEQERFQEI